MTLDDAIKHAEEVVEEQEKAAKEWHENQVRKCELFSFVEMDYTHENECKKCADEHRQLAEWLKDYKRLLEQQSSEDCVSREFIGVKVEYPPEDLCTYPEYKGKPYFSIVYRENDEEIIGYGTYKPEVLTDYLKRYFMPTIPSSEDCVSRQAVIAIASDSCLDLDSYEDTKEFCDEIKDLLPVTPTHGTCKDCKHFHNVRKDFYICDLWTIACTDNHYCANFEKRGNENESIN